MKRFFYMSCLTIGVLSISCKGTKSVTEGEVATTTNISRVLANHEKASPNFKTMASRIQVMYDDGSKEQSITVSLRMEKDQIIWMKASILGITLAKAMITPQKVQYYETISNTYFDGDFSLLSEWLGTQLDFQKTQAILLGQSIFDVNDANYKMSMFQKRYKIQPKRQPQDFIHSLFLDPGNFKVVSGSLSQPKEARLLSIRYGNYQTLEGGFYPSEIFIDATQKNEKTKISVTYKKIDINANVSFPFEIPDGFEPIDLSK